MLSQSKKLRMRLPIVMFLSSPPCSSPQEINLDKLWSLVGTEVYEAAKASAGKAPLIDVTQSGYFKVLGKGVLPAVPLIVKAKFFSKLAEKKIKEAGGACLLTA
jgi:large subunit ribosomal protein L27Ae